MRLACWSLFVAHALQGKPFDGVLHAACSIAVASVRHVLGGANEVFSVPIPELRKRLFRDRER